MASSPGTPAAPNRMASARCAISNVRCGRGSPAASTPAPTTGASVSSSALAPRAARNTFTASAVTSLPMPSPGNTAIFILRFKSPCFVERSPLAIIALECLYLVQLRQRVAQLIQSAQQTALAVGIDLEAVASAFDCHRLRLEVHLHLQPRLSQHRLHHACHDCLGKRDREQAILGGVGYEDVPHAGCKHRANTVVIQRPDRVLAGGPAPEVRLGQDDARCAIGRFVEYEVGIL